ncbi:hypothetical protein [Helicobacter cetorum]|uniref:Uncharacterized protein n=1 Tax=Helicobacter cetorum (strain ATCC BAA-540 / CCUG 52418 / MIT 99-5656) TaxID=1163745 RepID=I0EQC9_HELCM|nr:hypothetical protein [Helicobacter cetorum]AFI05148.1 hypothetical protein HCD_00580 [Helicobacter cetorum MIT 99-5656]
MLKIKIKVCAIALLLCVVLWLIDANFISDCYSVISKQELSNIFITLIAGLFGFGIAIIPLAIQLFSQKTDFIHELKENNWNFLVIPLFNRLVGFLKVLFYFLIFLLFIQIFYHFKVDILKIKIIKNITSIVLFYAYLVFIGYFLWHMLKVIKDLQKLVNLFLKK